MRPRVSLGRWGLLPALCLLLALVACGGGSEEQVPSESAGTDLGPPAPGEQALLRCSEACSNHGHCGATLNQGLHVLLDRDGPVAAAGQHDMAVPAETLVTVRDVQPRTLVFLSGEERQHNFFRVLVPERSEEAWVADWCLVRVP